MRKRRMGIPCRVRVMDCSSLSSSSVRERLRAATLCRDILEYMRSGMELFVYNQCQIFGHYSTSKLRDAWGRGVGYSTGTDGIGPCIPHLFEYHLI